ncbi:ribosomal biogenesis protein LAS1L-like isoform X2 [Seriola lalandi dorsalis]|uniref:ribosomal biogenesis protein LAS1L-like isoform X2 n=1 Tax=Seriola lalandi dorsalis TaxID=1841481 RepID=UPI000C6F5429|nr:ribosomal biogenesis protein LAS1L-like isoform X2 [Seriola lalandi dorsalis]
MEGTSVEEEKEEEMEDKAEEETEEMEKGLQMVKQCTEGEEEEDERAKHVIKGSEVEEHDPQRDVGSEVEEEEDEDIDDRMKNITGLLGDLGADTVTADPEKKNEMGVCPESWWSLSLLEDTNRAHSTLDDVLQGLVVDGTRKSPGTSKEATTVFQVFEGQTCDE